MTQQARDPVFVAKCYDVLSDLVRMEASYSTAVEQAKGSRPATRFERSLQKGMVREAEKECTVLVAPFLEASIGHMKDFVIGLIEIGGESEVSDIRAFFFNSLD